MVRGERPIGAFFDDEVGDSCVIGAGAVDGQKGDLVDGLAQEEGYAGCDDGVAESRPIGFSEPLQGDDDNEQWYAIGGYGWHCGVENGRMTCGGVEPLGQGDV